MSTWTNSDGLKVNYNRTLSQQANGGVVTEGKGGQLVLEFDSQDVKNAETAGNTDGREPFLPANSFVTSSHFVVTEAFTAAGSATLTIGLAQEDGTVIDADGIDATIAKTAIDAVGEAVVNDGVLVDGTETVGTANAYVYFTTATGPWTAGKGKLIINFTKVA